MIDTPNNNIINKHFYINDYINGELFFQLSDFLFNQSVSFYEDYYKFKNTFILEKLKPYSVIATYTHLAEILFNYLKYYDGKIILITHNSDINITKDIFDKKPKCIMKWFSQNVNYNNDNLISLPIGLENNKWFQNIQKINRMKKILNTKKTNKNLLYINHSISTNVSERKEPYEIFKNKKWAILKYGKNGLNFKNYLKNIYNSKFVLSPDGNGIDTHRLWECLYLNTIPIVKNGINVDFYKDLPICIVESWKDINENFLISEYGRINKTKYNLDKLTYTYWKNLILKEKII